MPIQYTMWDIKRSITPTYFKRGKTYHKQKRVIHSSFSEDNKMLTGFVKGSESIYQVSIKIDLHSKLVHISGSCSCPVGSNCKHVAALLLAGLNKQEEEPVIELCHDEGVIDDYRIRDWLTKVEQLSAPSDVYPQGVNKRLLYILMLEDSIYGKHVTVELVARTALKKGGFGKGKRYNAQNAYSDNPARFLRPNDIYILKCLADESNRNRIYYEDTYKLRDKNGMRMLREILETGRCYWLDTQEEPLLWSDEERLAPISWEPAHDGTQTVRCETNAEIDAVLPLSPPCYIDLKKRCCGRLNTGVNDDMACTLLAAPPLKPDVAEIVSKRLSSCFKEKEIALPKTFQNAKQKRIKPTAHLRLSFTTLQEMRQFSWNIGAENRVRTLSATLSFIYNGAKFTYGDKKGQELTFLENDVLMSFKRNESFESKSFKTLKTHGFVPISRLDREFLIPEDHAHDLLMSDLSENLVKDEEITSRWLSFSMNVLPKLRSKGWEIEIDPDFPFNVVEADEEWYADIDESGGTDWFGMELGITVEGEKVNILPLLLKGIKQNPDVFSNLEKEIPPEVKIFFPLPDKRMLALPFERIRLMLSFLKDLYGFENLQEDGVLKLSRFDSIDMVDFKAAMDAVNMRWFGGERVKRLGEKLKSFSEVEVVDVPNSFKGELRDYQKDGLNWLEFLREYEMGGILADDMGLGKTVQTLAYIACEKEKNGLDKPVLVVAPTSLMFNWQREAEHFTPELKVLKLHGTERKAHYDKIQDNDIILTTYPLLARDKEKLLEVEYHTIILDEAQNIKNPKTKVAQTALQLKGDNRICLTGTPLENHLGELWSLFNFLMPGLLGSEKEFRMFYRKPIEKEGNESRRKALVRRLKPFMLRRTKEKVARELPPKTEMVRTSEMKKSQRELYETIRISMHEKVRKAISEKGFSRSHIVVLDALLKLRQVCCDPKLLKIEHAKNVKESAKLEQLREMLPEMVEEGRRILLFSQFVSMLKLIEEVLQKENIDYVKLTGQTKDRQKPVERFQNGEVPVFLISLKAGGTGLNLTAADTVIHYDPWWNPAVENQATDRAHRIGQDKPVFVYKLITSGTVEEKILQMQEKKRSLAEGIFDVNSKAARKLTSKDISALFEPMG